jgi:hypothetical protein
MYAQNARLAVIHSDESLSRGDKEAGAIRRRSKQVRGAQRAALAAQGIDIDSGSAADIQDETQQMTDMDVMTVKNNAWREAFGYRIQATNDSLSANMSQSAASNAARNTLLTGGMQALDLGARAYGIYKKEYA